MLRDELDLFRIIHLIDKMHAALSVLICHSSANPSKTYSHIKAVNNYTKSIWLDDQR